MTYTPAQLDRIDALVAEKVMGWKWHNRLLCWVLGGVATLSETRSKRDYQPTRSIANAWEVVEHFGVLPVSIDNCWRDVGGERVSGWTCEITSHECTGEATASTAPLAICLAALRALGIDVEKEIARGPEVKA